MKHMCKNGRLVAVVRRTLAVALSAVVLMQQVSVQATEGDSGIVQNESTVSSGDVVIIDDTQGSNQDGTQNSIMTVSSGDATVFETSTTVSSGDNSFIPYEFRSEDYCIELSTESVVSGSVVKATLKYMGVESRESVNVVWQADTNKFCALSQNVGTENILSTQDYKIVANEASTQCISAELYHNEHYMGTVISNEILFIKDSVAPIIENVYYATGNNELQELDRAVPVWGCGNLKLEVKVSDIDSDNEENIVSGVKKVYAEVRGTKHNLEYDSNTDTWKKEIDMPEWVYVMFAPTIYVEDNANNVSYEGLPWFHIDREQPKVELGLINSEGTVEGWYSESVHEEKLKIKVSVEDKSEIQKIEVSNTEDFSTVIETLTDIIELNPGSYVAQTSEGVISGEQNKTYYVRTFDEWGNTTTKSIQVTIDNTVPADEVNVEFCVTEDMLIKLEGTEEGTHEYVISQKQGCIYDNDKISLLLAMEDNAVEGAVSGIASVNFVLQIKDGNSGEITHTSVEIPMEKIFTAEDGKSYISYDLGIPDSNVFEKSFQICDLFITDKAGNVCPGSIAGLQDQVVYYVDNSAPRVEYAYGTGELGAGNEEETSEGIVRYFNQPYIANITVTDANLCAVEVTNAMVEGNQQAEIVRVAKTEDEAIKTVENYQYTLSIDGKYQLCVQADDILCNGTIDGEMISVLSDSIVVDTLAPQIDIAVCKGTGEIVSDYANQYFAQDMTIQMSIEELYLDMESVQVLISGVSATGEAIAITLEPDSWSADGSIYTNQYQIKEEGYYTVSVTCKDKAGNSNELMTEGFYIDKTAPLVTITYDKNEPMNQFYYNDTRIATVTVEDYSFDDTNTQFDVKSVYGNQPAIGEWIHQAGSACDGSHHTKNCTYSVQVRFEKDDIYDFTFSCVDKAGLQSEAIEAEHFVIDKTAPVISITFDHYEVSHEYFYKKARTAFVQIDDISFSADLVNIAKSSNQTVDNLPALTDFTGGGKVHTTSIYFDKDGTYEFTTEVTDLAGNKAEIVTSPLFIIDMTAPEVLISGVGNFSANKGSVMPQVEYRDKYLYDEDSILEISGYYHGVIAKDFVKETVTDGYTINYTDFAYTQDIDDLYTLNVIIKDYAGNETTDTLVFSVNRFGSVYVLSEACRAALEGYYHSEAPEIVITEINVDNLEKRQVTSSRDGITASLTEGTDYSVQKQGTEVTWKSYTYILPESNFEEEGHYAITVASTDKAKNSSDNRSKGTEVTFAVDKTTPSIVVSDIEENGIYNTEELTVRADIKDNMSLEYVAIYDGYELLGEYDADALADNLGEITFKLTEDTDKRDIRIFARDSAGNTQEQVYKQVLVSTVFSQIAENITPLAVSASEDYESQNPMLMLGFVIIAVSALFVGTGIVFVIKKRKSR